MAMSKRFLASGTVLTALFLGIGCSSKTPAKVEPVSMPAAEAPVENKQAKPKEDPLKGKAPAEWLAALKDDPSRRREAATVLIGVDAQARVALVPPLLEALKNSDAEVRQLSAYVLGNINPPPASVLPTLAATLRDRDEAVRRAAATALVQVGRNTPETLIPLLQAAAVDDDVDVRQLAIYVAQTADPDNKKLAFLEANKQAGTTSATTERKLPVANGSGLTQTDLRDAETFHQEAVYLHVRRQIGEAAAKMRQAAALAPRKTAYAAYLAELEALTLVDAIDRHALKAPEALEQDMASLANYLTIPARSDRDRARAIFRWIADRISYNAEGFFSNDTGDNSAEGAFKNRKCVCLGYANLFAKLCKHAGLEAVMLIGESKGAVSPADRDARAYHAWNAVRLDGKWHLLDVTWSAGFIDGRTYKKHFTDYFFLTPPDQFIFSHYPHEMKWQLLDSPISHQEYTDWPRPPPARLLQLGVPADKVRIYLGYKLPGGLVQAFDLYGPKITLRKVPLQKKLKQGTHTFRIEAPGVLEIALINGRQWHHLTKNGSVFEGSVPVDKGDLVVGVRTRSLYAGILKYTVE